MTPSPGRADGGKERDDARECECCAQRFATYPAIDFYHLIDDRQLSSSSCSIPRLWFNVSVRYVRVYIGTVHGISTYAAECSPTCEHNLIPSAIHGYNWTLSFNQCVDQIAARNFTYHIGGGLTANVAGFKASQHTDLSRSPKQISSLSRQFQRTSMQLSRPLSGNPLRFDRGANITYIASRQPPSHQRRSRLRHSFILSPSLDP